MEWREIKMSLLPEGGGEEEEDGEDFEAAGEHDEREYPFAEGGNYVVLGTIAGDCGVKSGIGNAGEGREEGVDQRDSHGCEDDGSGGDDHAVEAEEDDDFRHEVGRHGTAAQADGVDIVGVDAAVYLVAGVLAEHEHTVDFGSAAGGAGAGSGKHEHEGEGEGKCAPVAESGGDVTG